MWLAYRACSRDGWDGIKMEMKIYLVTQKRKPKNYNNPEKQSGTKGNSINTNIYRFIIFKNI